MAKALEVVSYCRQVAAIGQDLSNPTVRGAMGAMAAPGVGPGASITYSVVVKAAISYLRDHRSCHRV